ncbi:MAG: barstar family protein [Saprospiraceae bacterium]|nr:barstar family protein [Saprospiraceae bacterium]
MKFIRIASPDTEIKRGNNKIVVEINGSEINDWKALYDLITENLHFPGYFGENLDALYDMLLDLQWLKQDTIELVISDYQKLLSDEDEYEKNEFLFLLEDVCREWKEGDFEDDEWEIKKFRVMVLCDEQEGSRIKEAIDSMMDDVEEID